MSSRHKKIIATMAAVVLILALGLAGTFAASSSGDSSGNIEGEVETSIFLHDDFSKNWDGDVMDRDVYVENTGDTSLYVRMRLDEFMTYGGKKLVGGDRDQQSTWKPHVPAGSNPSECGTEIHDYFTIQMGNDAGVKYKSKTKNAYNPAITEAEKTEMTAAAKIILMEDYLKAEVKPEACWVLDTADGYAYWHQQLPKGKATGLILNSITNTGLIDESYYYGINAKAEAVTEMDLNAWLNGRPPRDSTTGEAFDQASTNAGRFLKNLSPKYIEITEEMEANGANDFDGDNDGYLTKKEYTEYEAEKGITPTPELTLKEKVKAASVGDIVKLQNKDGSMTEWIVYNKTASEADLFSKESVTSRQYHATTPYPGWPNSDIRAWLNDGISGYKSQLSEEMKTAIKAQNLKTASAFDNWNTTQNSTDEIYLLTEINNNSNKVGKDIGDAVTLTEEQLKCSNAAEDGSVTSYWWLRSPKTGTEYAARMYYTNPKQVIDYAVKNATGIRPALTISVQ